MFPHVKSNNVSEKWKQLLIHYSLIIPKYIHDIHVLFIAHVGVLKNRIRVKGMVSLETFEGARENRMRWGENPATSGNNVYNAPFRWNLKFVSLSTIIFRNLHTNRFRRLCAMEHEACEYSFASIPPLLHPRTCIEKRYDSTRHLRTLSIIRGGTTLKFYPFRFRGMKYCLVVLW